jgi:hypothetical protein
MSLFFKELQEACQNKKLVRIAMMHGAVYTGFIKDLDEYHVKIAHLDIVNNSDTDKGFDALGEYLDTGNPAKKVEFDEYQKEIDYIFCDSIIKLDNIDKIDIDVIHSLKPSTAQYTSFYKDNELKPATKEPSKRKKKSKPVDVDLE